MAGYYYYCKLSFLSCHWLLTLFLLTLSALSAQGRRDEFLMDEIVVQLSDADLNSIKSSELCSSGLGGQDCFLTFLPVAVLDAMGTSLAGTGEGQCLPVTQFQEDQSSPQLVNFVLFDFDTGLLMLNFSEVVRTSSVNFTAISLRDTFLRVGTSYTLTPGEVIGTMFSTNITLQLNTEDLNALKRIDAICLSLSNCWLSFTQNFLTDVAGNAIEPSRDGNSDANRLALEVLPDITPPNVVAFDLDLNAEEVTLYFDETVGGTFDGGGIVFGASENVSMNYSLTGPVFAVNPTTSFTFSLQLQDVLALKAVDGLLTSADDTFVTYGSGLITDRAGIGTAPREVGLNALNVRTFVPDSTPPQLSSFDLLDIDNDLMQITFNEPVDIASVNFSSIVVRSGPLSDPDAIEIPLSGARSVRYLSESRLSIEIGFNSADFQAIKLQPTIATGTGNSFVQLLAGAFADVAGNGNEETAAVGALSHMRDTRGPMLTSFSLNLTSDVLSLTFDDVVDVNGSLDVTELTLQADRTGVSVAAYTLRNSSSGSSNGLVFDISLSRFDSNAIKAIPGLAVNINTTFLSFTAEFLRDVFGANVISVIPSDAVPAVAFFSDELPPELLRFGLDYVRETLSLTFQETVQLASFDISLLTLQNTETGASSSYALTGGQITSGLYPTSFSIVLTREDLNAIKLIENLAVSEATTYLSFPTATISDANNNYVVAYSVDNGAQRVSTFVADTLPPVLREFSLDMNVGRLSITFDETVNVATFRPGQITLSSSSSSDGVSYNLTGGSNSLTNSPIVAVNISDSDLNAIKRLLGLATSRDDTYISFFDDVVSDMNGNGYEPEPRRQAASFVSDETRPELEDFSLDVNAGRLALTFSETVDSTSLAVTTITLLADASNITDADLYHTLTVGVSPNGSFTPSLNNTVIIVELGRTDLDEIKRLDQLSTDLVNTFISITNATVLDMNANPVEEIPRDFAFQASEVTPDTTPPELVMFSLDLNTGDLRLTFSETVNASTLIIGALTLLSDSTGSGELYTLQDSSNANVDSVTVDVTLGAMDLNLIKYRTSLAVGSASTYLRLANDGVRDTNDNFYANGSTVLSVTPNTLVPDGVPPNLQSFGLDVDAGVLSLTFDEVVNASTLRVTAVTLHNDAISSTSNFTLNGGTLSGANLAPGHPPVVDLTLLGDDLNSIKRLVALATSNETTFLSVSFDAVLDLAPVPNSLTGTEAGDNLRVAEFTEDSTPPELVDFDVDLTEEVIVLAFDETVNILSFDAAEFTLHSDRDLVSSAQNRTIASSFVISTTNDTEVIVRIEKGDLDAIKLFTSLCTSETNCFLSLTETAISDTNGNDLVPVDGERVRKLFRRLDASTLPGVRP